MPVTLLGFSPPELSPPGEAVAPLGARSLPAVCDRYGCPDVRRLAIPRRPRTTTERRNFRSRRCPRSRPRPSSAPRVFHASVHALPSRFTTRRPRARRACHEHDPLAPKGSLHLPRPASADRAAPRSGTSPESVVRLPGVNRKWTRCSPGVSFLSRAGHGPLSLRFRRLSSHELRRLGLHPVARGPRELAEGRWPFGVSIGSVFVREALASGPPS